MSTGDRLQVFGSSRDWDDDFAPVPEQLHALVTTPEVFLCSYRIYFLICDTYIHIYFFVKHLEKVMFLHNIVRCALLNVSD